MCISNNRSTAPVLPFAANAEEGGSTRPAKSEETDPGAGRGPSPIAGRENAAGTAPGGGRQGTLGEPRPNLAPKMAAGSPGARPKAQGRGPRRNTGAGDAPGPKDRPRGTAHTHPTRRTPRPMGGKPTTQDPDHYCGGQTTGRETKQTERKTRAAASGGTGPGQTTHRRRRLPHTEPEGRAAEDKETTHRRGGGGGFIRGHTLRRPAGSGAAQ